MDLTGDRTRAVHVLCGVSQVERVLLQKRPDSLILPDSATNSPPFVPDVWVCHEGSEAASHPGLFCIQVVNDDEGLRIRSHEAH